MLCRGAISENVSGGFLAEVVKAPNRTMALLEALRPRAEETFFHGRILASPASTPTLGGSQPSPELYYVFFRGFAAVSIYATNSHTFGSLELTMVSFPWSRGLRGSIPCCKVLERLQGVHI